MSGFGPYVAVFLVEQKWTQQSIGFALTAGGFAGLLSQLPSGELLDAIRSKRVVVALGAPARNRLTASRPRKRCLRVIDGVAGATMVAASALIIAELVPAERLERATFDLEGHKIVPVDIGHTDTDNTTCLHVPSIGLVIAARLLLSQPTSELYERT